MPIKTRNARPLRILRTALALGLVLTIGSVAGMHGQAALAASPENLALIEDGIAFQNLWLINAALIALLGARAFPDQGPAILLAVCAVTATAFIGAGTVMAVAMVLTVAAIGLDFRKRAQIESRMDDRLARFRVLSRL